MTILCNATDPDPAPIPVPLRQPQPAITAWLTEADRQILTYSMDHCLSEDEELVAGVLRSKIDLAEIICGDAPPDVATLGCNVTYMVTGGGAQYGRLTCDDTGGDAIAITSLLGATLIGMRELQRAPLLRADGSILTLALLRVAPARKERAVEQRSPTANHGFPEENDLRA